MTLGTLNFVTVYQLLHRGPRELARSGQVRIFVVLSLAGALLLLALAAAPSFDSLGKAARVAVFEAVSAATTTGFSTTSYAGWPASSWLVLTLLMLVGGGAGSTAGGIKHGRVYLLWRVLLWELRRPFLPRQAVNRPEVTEGALRMPVTDEDVRRVAVFLFAYAGCYMIGTLVLSASEYPLPDALFEMASALGTVGRSVGVTAPDTPPLVLGTEILAMLLGRLEIMAVLLGLQRLLVDARAALRG
jgi:trk system potassium uptake protein TrkH